MADLLALSARIIDEGVTDEPVNRPSGQLSEVADGIAVVEAFSHVVAFRTGDGLVLFDTSVEGFGEACRAAIRGWAPDERVSTIVYTHGHVDHVGGARRFVDEAVERGDPRPEVVAHENVPVRFDRYDLTNGYNAALAEPDDRDVHAARAEVYRARRAEELSLMSKGIFGTAAAESEARL